MPECGRYFPQGKAVVSALTLARLAFFCIFHVSPRFCVTTNKTSVLLPEKWKSVLENVTPGEVSKAQLCWSEAEWCGIKEPPTPHLPLAGWGEGELALKQELSLESSKRRDEEGRREISSGSNPGEYHKGTT